jgi:predicted Zn-dependent protease
LTDFISEIRSSLAEAGDGRPLRQEPVYARAQLASVLRDVGLVSEARQEGEAALAELATKPQPTMSDHSSRNTFRALARANEGAGHDADALRWYSDFIQFASGYRQCSTCHQLGGPTSDAFFRDWWAGRRFGELAVRAGVAPQLIEAAKKALTASPENLLAQIRLAYLYEGQGDTIAAANIWAHVDRGPAPVVATLR